MSSPLKMPHRGATPSPTKSSSKRALRRTPRSTPDHLDQRRHRERPFSHRAHLPDTCYRRSPKRAKPATPDRSHTHATFAASARRAAPTLARQSARLNSITSSHHINLTSIAFLTEQHRVQHPLCSPTAQSIVATKGIAEAPPAAPPTCGKARGANGTALDSPRACAEQPCRRRCARGPATHQQPAPRRFTGPAGDPSRSSSVGRRPRDGGAPVRHRGRTPTSGARASAEARMAPSTPYDASSRTSAWSASTSAA